VSSSKKRKNGKMTAEAIAKAIASPIVRNYQLNVEELKKLSLQQDHQLQILSSQLKQLIRQGATV
jgi:dephospho-CoA kinase